ncbi:hypothetical protein Dsin_023919 [Dipteronia sinensis]|uniref:Uncharacterized protein n=1 Tax=Dipteronia sinensis TaxID=43782 RepID=A0AAE0A5S1_9ROSI|nr:hypothetical protein Dsin_023919 [Dipteronia sinensis]
MEARASSCLDISRNALKSSLKLSTLANAIALKRLIRKGMVSNAATMVTIHLELYPWCNNDCDTTSCYSNIEKQPPLCEICCQLGVIMKCRYTLFLLSAQIYLELIRWMVKLVDRCLVPYLSHGYADRISRMEGGIPPLVELLEFTDIKVQRVTDGARGPWHL